MALTNYAYAYQGLLPLPDFGVPMFMVPSMSSAASQYQQFLYQQQIDHFPVGNVARGIFNHQVPLQVEDGSTTEPVAQSPAISDHLSSVAGMQNMISMLRNALVKEVDDRKKYVWAMNKKLDESEKMKRSLLLRVDELVNEKRTTDEMNFKVALIDAEFTQNQLTDLKSQLNTLQGEVKELKETKMSLEKDFNESKKQVEAANVVIQKLEADRAFSEKKVDDLNAELIKAKATQQELELNLGTMRIELESASKGAGVELAREQTQLFEDKVPENVTLAKQFKELAKRHLHIIANSGERMYNGFEMKTKEFVNNLDLSLSLVNDDISASQQIQEVIDVVTIQLQDIETCRQDFKTTVEVLMDRVDKGLTQVSDLSVKAFRPQFKIAPESFEEVFQNLTGLRAGPGLFDFNSTLDAAQFTQVASPDVLDEEPDSPQESSSPSWLC